MTESYYNTRSSWDEEAEKLLPGVNVTVVPVKVDDANQILNSIPADVDTVVFRGYAGNVGPTTGQILYDNDVDIMLGWGSVENICHTTGSIPEESILESVKYQITYNGEPLNRYIHRFGSSEGSLKLMEYLLSSDSVNYFNQ